jgi:hypothetical protein
MFMLTALPAVCSPEFSILEASATLSDTCCSSFKVFVQATNIVVAIHPFVLLLLPYAHVQQRVAVLTNALGSSAQECCLDLNDHLAFLLDQY